MALSKPQMIVKQHLEDGLSLFQKMGIGVPGTIAVYAHQPAAPSYWHGEAGSPMISPPSPSVPHSFSES